ncbi:hypothetical protein BDD12DRAFT_897885 [Trichophaea hybrida]|nr:hypothetical protein BDD12DRAFT_897885 [Trichophaea hybrida]
MSQPPPNVSAPFSQLSLSPSFHTARSQFIERYAFDLCEAIFTRGQLAFSIAAICPILETVPSLGAAIAEVVKAVVTPLRAEIKALQSDVEELRDDKMSLKEDKRHLQADKAMFAETMNGLRNDKAKLESDKSKLEHDKSKLEHDKSKLQEDKSGLQLDKERYATLIENLEEHLAYMHLKERQLLEHGYRTHDIFEGSLGRRKMWQKVADSVRHEEHPSSSTELSRAHKNHIRRLMAAVFVSNSRDEYKVEKEAQMYPFVQETLHKILSDSKNDNQVAVIDTTNSPYLPGIAPDMSLSLRNMVRPFAACMYGVLELKRCADKELQEDENLGQVYDYLVSIKRSQPNRHIFLGILSNIRCSVVMTIEGNQNRITMHSPASWEDMVVYLLDHVCKQDSVFTPALPPFTIGITHMQKQLGVTRRSTVASFQYLNQGSIAIKCASKEEFGSAIKREVTILRKLTHRNLPQLIYDPSPEALEFGIKPVGRPFALHMFPSASTLRSAVLETLSALHWLHTSPNIIHRDIRREHIILDKLQPVIIDFGHAVDLSLVPQQPHASTKAATSVVLARC